MVKIGTTRQYKPRKKRDETVAKLIPSHIQTGREGEAAAKSYLERNGFRILATNWRWQRYEIDIIALKDNILHFVEVKTRRAAGSTTPEEGLTAQKSRMLIFSADNYVRYYRMNYEAQIDLAAVDVMPDDSMEVRFIPNAVVPHW